MGGGRESVVNIPLAQKTVPCIKSYISFYQKFNDVKYFSKFYKERIYKKYIHL